MRDISRQERSVSDETIGDTCCQYTGAAAAESAAINIPRSDRYRACDHCCGRITVIEERRRKGGRSRSLTTRRLRREGDRVKAKRHG